MAIYTVHAPASYGADVRVTPDKVLFVRDGFYFWAFVASIIWLIWNRLWLALIGYIALSLAAEFALRFVGASSGTHFLVMFVFALLVGLEAGSLRRWKYSRGKWRQLDVVVAKNEEEAERRFFDRGGVSDSFNGPPPVLMPRSSLTPGNDVVGLFPEPGASR